MKPILYSAFVFVGLFSSYVEGRTIRTIQITIFSAPESVASNFNGTLTLGIKPLHTYSLNPGEGHPISFHYDLAQPPMMVVTTLKVTQTNPKVKKAFVCVQKLDREKFTCSKKKKRVFDNYSLHIEKNISSLFVFAIKKANHLLCPKEKLPCILIQERP